MTPQTIAKIAQIGHNHPVDALGAIKAQIADLTEQAKPLEADIKAMGAGKHTGQLFSATVAEVDPSTSPDPVAMEAKLRELGIKDTWFRHHMKTKKGYLRLSITDR